MALHAPLSIRMLLSGRAEGQRLDDELPFHLNGQGAEKLAPTGISPHEARYLIRTFGYLPFRRDRGRATWTWSQRGPR